MSQLPSLTPESLTSLLRIGNPTVASPGDKLVYTTVSVTKSEEHLKSQIHIADPSKPHSSRPLTSGLFNDTTPKFSPSGDTVAFVSDRSEAGKTSAIYLISTTGPGEPYPITKADKKRSISKIVWSPCGNFIAYISADEKTDEKKRQEEEKDDAEVYGEDWAWGRLRLVHVRTKEVRTLVQSDKHVVDFAWNEGVDRADKEIAYCFTKTPEIDSGSNYGTGIGKLTVSGSSNPEGESEICWFGGAIVTADGSIVSKGQAIYFLAGITPESICTAWTAWKLDLKDENPAPRQLVGDGPWSFSGIRAWSTKAITTLRQVGMKDEILSIDVSGDTTSIHTSEKQITAWDYRDDKLILVISDINTPQEVYSLSLSSKAEPICLSKHNNTLLSSPLATQIVLSTSHPDGTPCSGHLMLPKTLGEGSPSPVPLLVSIHGGPYGRSAVTFCEDARFWNPYLLSLGYAVLCSNYRGGSGWGEEYAAAARGKVGGLEYEDVMVTVHHVLKEYGRKGKGLLDDDKVAVGGWSQGGFLSYVSAVRGTKARAQGPDDSITAPHPFKLAICGAGVTDWDMMSMSSDVPKFESELGGSAPWTSDKHETLARNGSPIWEMRPAADAVRKIAGKTIKVRDLYTPVLILHGEKDERVPLSQAIAFRRGCQEYGWPFEMAVYPREPHGVSEKAHVIDMMNRVIRNMDARLK